jgi:uncharacterized protein (DUF433 family)
MTVTTSYEHVVLDENRVPLIAGTTIKVVELVLDHLAYGWSPEELHFQHPDLTMGQIHSALAYYWDHKTALDADIDRRTLAAEQIRRAVPPPPFAGRAGGQLPG